MVVAAIDAAAAATTIAETFFFFFFFHQLHVYLFILLWYFFFSFAKTDCWMNSLKINTHTICYLSSHSFEILWCYECVWNLAWNWTFYYLLCWFFSAPPDEKLVCIFFALNFDFTIKIATADVMKLNNHQTFHRMAKRKCVFQLEWFVFGDTSIRIPVEIE